MSPPDTPPDVSPRWRVSARRFISEGNGAMQMQPRRNWFDAVAAQYRAAIGSCSSRGWSQTHCWCICKPRSVLVSSLALAADADVGVMR